MRVGSREAGRDGVQTIKAKDDRIKYVALSHCHCFQVCTQISLHSVLCWKFLCSSNPSNVLLSCIFFSLSDMMGFTMDLATWNTHTFWQQLEQKVYKLLL